VDTTLEACNSAEYQSKVYMYSLCEVPQIVLV
jgi:hypothetical protein